MLTKTQVKIMQVFASRINEKFSIKQIAKELRKPYALIHKSIKPLINGKVVGRDNKELLSLNYRENFSTLSFIEGLRAKEFLNKQKLFSLFVNDVLRNIKLNYFVFLVFGSAVENANPRDIDILLIVEHKEKINEIEKFLENIASSFSINLHINVIHLESAYEMLAKREQANLMNECLNKHILLYGAENYYTILKNAR